VWGRDVPGKSRGTEVLALPFGRYLYFSRDAPELTADWGDFLCRLVIHMGRGRPESKGGVRCHVHAC